MSRRAQAAQVAAAAGAYNWYAPPSASWKVSPADAARWEAEKSLRREERARREMIRRASSAEVLAWWSECTRCYPNDFDAFQPLTRLSPETFQKWLAASENVRYDYHCVLNGSPLTFGIEVEFIGNLKEVARTFHAAGLAISPEIQVHNAVRGWNVKEDTSVPDGGEVVSPVLRDQPVHWQQVRRALAILQQLGCTVDNTCGMHVHLGAFRLENRSDRFRRLWQINAALEDILYRLAAPDGNRVHRGVDWTQPLSKKGYVKLGTVADFQSQATHVDALNFEHVGTARNTVEFRYPNSTLNHIVVQVLICLFAGIMEAACDDTLTPDNLPSATPYGTHVDGNVVDLHDSTVRRMADLLFPRNSRSKLRLLWLYRRTRWQGEALARESTLADLPARYPGLAA